MEESIEKFMEIQDKERAIQEIMDSYGQSSLILILEFFLNSFPELPAKLKIVKFKLVQRIF